MTVEIRRVKEAKFYIEADLEWLERQLNDERVKGFGEWMGNLTFGVPKSIAQEVEEYKASILLTLDGLRDIRDRLQAEKDDIENTIDLTRVAVSDEVKRYLPKEEEPEGEVRE